MAAFLIVATVFAIRLFSIQVVSDEFRLAADNNSRSRKTDYPLRGPIYDRTGKLIVQNNVVFDIMVIPKQFKILDSLRFCKEFDIEIEYLRTQLTKAKEHSRHQPSLLLKQLTREEFARIQDHLIRYPGLVVNNINIREYPGNSLANVLGYVKEVDQAVLASDTTKYYRKGDLIGKTGVEYAYEEWLRGRRGVRYVMTNVRGVVKGKYEGGRYDTLAQMGTPLVSSIDIELQQYGELLMKNKRGSVVAIEPETGEILAMISSPSYDPNLLAGQGKSLAKNYFALATDPLNPLINRATQSWYPPGSTFKTIMALIGLQTGALDTVHTSFPCAGEPLGCHNHPSPLSVFGSIQHSCNPWYYKSFRRTMFNSSLNPKGETKEGLKMALDQWQGYLHQFGLGKRLGIDLPFEKSGIAPSAAYYDRAYGGRDWKISNIYSISIGQGEVIVMPIQLANVAAAIANRGWYITPHIIKGIGDTGEPQPQYKEKHHIDIKREYFDFVARAMAEVVRAGTARRAYMPDIVVCGKTGTAQNPHGKDHSIFMSFAPLDNPKIAIAVYVENSGFGGTWAAPIASLMIEKYIKRKVDRPHLEKYILDADFISEAL